MDPEAAAAITPHLLAGEMLLWSGRPRDTSPLRIRAIMIAVVGATAIAMRALAPDLNIGERAAANSIILAIVVAGMIAEAMVFHAFLSGTFYGVTNLRVIIVSGLREHQVSTVMLDRLNTSMLKLRRIGNTLELRAPRLQVTQEPTYLPFRNPSVLSWPDQPECLRLVGLENVGEVYRVILEAADKLG